MPKIGSKRVKTKTHTAETELPTDVPRCNNTNLI